MKEFDDLQKKIIKVLAKTKAPAEIDLTSILLQFIPEDMFIGVTDSDDVLQKMGFIQYKENQIEFVQGILSIKISSFVNLIEELVKNDYIIKERIAKPFVPLSIGTPSTDYKNYVRYSLGSNLNYEKLREVFIESKYYTTVALNKLPKYDYLDSTTYISFKQLSWTRLALILTALTIVVDIVLKFIDLRGYN